MYAYFVTTSFCTSYQRLFVSFLYRYLVDNDAPAGNLLLAQGCQQPPGLVYPQHSGDGGDNEFCEVLVTEELLHHHHAVLQLTT